MRKIFLLVVLLILMYSFSFAQSEKNNVSSIVANLRETSVSIFTYGKGISMCSGTIIKNTQKEAIVLTARHCVTFDSNMYVDNVFVTDWEISKKNDLALLITKGFIQNKKSAIIAPRNPQVDDIVYFLGYPQMIEYVSVGLIIRYTLDDYYAWMKVMPGCSGGGIFNEKNELIGVLWGALTFNESKTFAVFSPTLEIIQFLKESGYYEKSSRNN